MTAITTKATLWKSLIVRLDKTLVTLNDSLKFNKRSQFFIGVHNDSKESFAHARMHRG